MRKRRVQVFEAGSAARAHEQATFVQRLFYDRAALERRDVYAQARFGGQEVLSEGAPPTDQGQALPITAGRGEELSQVRFARAGHDRNRVLLQGARRAQTLRLGFHRTAR
jgi:hypothetical protein